VNLSLLRVGKVISAEKTRGNFLPVNLSWLREGKVISTEQTQQKNAKLKKKVQKRKEIACPLWAAVHRCICQSHIPLQ